MLITRSDDGYFGLRQRLAGVFGEAVATPSVDQRALLDRRRSSSGTINSKTNKPLDVQIINEVGVAHDDAITLAGVFSQ